MLNNLAEPTKPEELDEKVCAEIDALLKQDPLRTNAISKNYQQVHWRRLAAQAILFLGRNEAGKLLAVGCMSICPTLTNGVARIGEIVIDKDSRNESMERNIFFALTSWAGVMTDAISVELDDRLCAVSEPILKEALHTGKLAKINSEGRILKLALVGFANGTFVRKIDACRFLVEKGFWKHSPERRIDEMDAILRDMFYMGQIEYLAWGVTRRKGQHEGIIDLETFEAIQRRLKKDGIHKRVRLDITEDFPQRGLTVCDSCGKHLTAAWSKGNGGRYGFYYCQNSTCPLYRKSARKDDVEIGFNKLLKKTQLKKDVDKIIGAIFDRTWKDEISNLTAKETALERRRKDLKEKIGQLSDAAIKAKTEEIREAYEGQMQEAANALKEPENQLLGEIDYSVPYRTALGKATGMLKNPSDTWEALGVREKQKLFFFIFEKKLAYSIKDGYRTDEIPTAARLFEDFVVQNTLTVEMGGIEPPCNDDANEPSTSVV